MFLKWTHAMFAAQMNLVATVAIHPSDCVTIIPIGVERWTTVFLHVIPNWIDFLKRVGHKTANKRSIFAIRNDKALQFVRAETQILRAVFAFYCLIGLLHARCHHVWVNKNKAIALELTQLSMISTVVTDTHTGLGVFAGDKPPLTVRRQAKARIANYTVAATIRTKARRSIRLVAVSLEEFVSKRFECVASWLEDFVEIKERTLNFWLQNFSLFACGFQMAVLELFRAFPKQFEPIKDQKTFFIRSQMPFVPLAQKIRGKAAI